MSEDKRDAFGRIQEEPTVIVGGFNNEPGLTPPADDVREAVARLSNHVFHGEYFKRTATVVEVSDLRLVLDALIAAEVRPHGAPADDVREALIGGIARDEQDWRFGDFEETSNHSPSLAEYIADGILANLLIEVRPRGTVTDAADIISALSDFGRFGPLGYREQKIAEAAIALARA